MSQRSKVVVGNWKMHGSLAANAELVASLTTSLRADQGGAGVVLCVPYPYLAQVSRAVEGSAIAVGAQNVSEYEKGAYTGEVSAAMLVDFGCRQVIVGHSERRTLFGDTDERVALKAERAIDAGLVPIVCIGETLAERDAGDAVAVVTRQLDAVLARLGGTGFARLQLAYEPVWAIGTGKTASPEEAQAMHAAIRAHVAASDADVASEVKILYGGSVKASNAASLFGCADIDGGLIGGASLVADDFLGIVAAAHGSGASAAGLRAA